MLIESIKAALRKDEGLRLKRYLDTEDLPTIGYGWQIAANPLPPDIAAYEKDHGEITLEMAEQLLDITVRLAIGQAMKLFPNLLKYTENRQEALVNLVFNMGVSKLKKSFPSLCAAVKREDWDRVADELKYKNGLKKGKLSDYWVQLHGDPDGKDDGKAERPEIIYKLIKEG